MSAQQFQQGDRVRVRFNTGETATGAIYHSSMGLTGRYLVRLDEPPKKGEKGLLFARVRGEFLEPLPETSEESEDIVA